MLASEWLPLLEVHEKELLSNLDLEGYSFVQGGPFGNTFEYRPGAQWMVLEAVHPNGEKRAVRVPVHDRFAQEDHITRLKLIAQELKNQDAGWFPSFDIHPYEFGGEVALTPCPVMVMDWIEGQSIASVLSNHRHDHQKLEDLENQLSELIDEMIRGGFDHGDISVTNLRVRPNGMLMLLDPDSLVHESMKISKSLELGHATWNHSKRTEMHTKLLHIIPFHLMKWLIRGLMTNPLLLHEEPDVEEYFFTEADLAGPYQSPRFHALMEALDLSPTTLEHHPLGHLMEALADDFENIGLHLPLPDITPHRPSVTIDYLIHCTPIKRATSLGRRPVKLHRRLLRPTSFSLEFNRFKSE